MIPPRYIHWSSPSLDLSDPFQKNYYLRQVLLHGRASDIRNLDLQEVAQALDELRLPPAVYSLWKRYFRDAGYEGFE